MSSSFIFFNFAAWQVWKIPSEILFTIEPPPKKKSEKKKANYFNERRLIFKWIKSVYNVYKLKNIIIFILILK